MLQNVNQKSCGMVFAFFQSDKVRMEQDSQKHRAARWCGVQKGAVKKEALCFFLHSACVFGLGFWGQIGKGLGEDIIRLF